MAVLSESSVKLQQEWGEATQQVPLSLGLGLGLSLNLTQQVAQVTAESMQVAGREGTSVCGVREA